MILFKVNWCVRESSKGCFKNIFKEIDVNVLGSVIERAHRIGNISHKPGKRSLQIAVRFPILRHRKAVYRTKS